MIWAANDEGAGAWSTIGEGTADSGSVARNNEPTFPEGATATRAVDENTTADVAFGDPVAATDDDSGDTLSYSLSGTDAASFAIVESSGQLKTKAMLDYETKSSYSVEVRADDGFVVENIAVTINVNDVNEAPVFPDGAPSLDVNGMPTFGTVPIGEARTNSVTGQRAALLQEYVGYIQHVAPGQAGMLGPGEGETTQEVRRRLTAASRNAGVPRAVGAVQDGERDDLPVSRPPSWRESLPAQGVASGHSARLHSSLLPVGTWPGPQRGQTPFRPTLSLCGSIQ